MHTLTKGNHIRRRGFTLIELVVVILILGIIGAIAAPRMFNTMATARTNAARESVQLLREAIEMYRTQDSNNAYPPDASSLALKLQPYLKGSFPASPLTNQNATVAASTDSPLVYIPGNTAGWLYNSTTGDFGLNDSAGVAY
jgi:general secretion pathway protein G